MLFNITLLSNVRSIYGPWEYNHGMLKTLCKETSIKIELLTSHGYIFRAHKMDANCLTMLWNSCSESKSIHILLAYNFEVCVGTLRYFMQIHCSHDYKAVIPVSCFGNLQSKMKCRWRPLYCWNKTVSPFCFNFNLYPFPLVSTYVMVLPDSSSFNILLCQAVVSTQDLQESLPIYCCQVAKFQANF